MWFLRLLGERLLACMIGVLLGRDLLLFGSVASQCRLVVSQRLLELAELLGQGRAGRLAGFGDVVDMRLLLVDRLLVVGDCILDELLAAIAHRDALIACALDILVAVVGAQQKAIIVPLLLLFLRRSEEHTSELQLLIRISYADFCLN